MALIHEQLNRDDEPDRLDFREYVETLARELFYSYGVDSERIRLRLRPGACFARPESGHSVRADFERTAHQFAEVRIP